MTPGSTVEFLAWLLIAASVIAARLRIPYTVALVLGGLALGSCGICNRDCVLTMTILQPAVL